MWLLADQTDQKFYSVLSHSKVFIFKILLIPQKNVLSQGRIAINSFWLESDLNYVWAEVHSRFSCQNLRALAIVSLLSFLSPKVSQQKITRFKFDR